MESRLVRIPRHLLHVQLDDLDAFGVPATFRAALRGVIADLALVPSARHSAQLIGPPEVTLPALAVVARHVGQGLRDDNLRLSHDRDQLRAERRKLVFVDAALLLITMEHGDQRPVQESALFVVGATEAVLPLLQAREARNLASFVATEAPIPGLEHWRLVQ